MEYALGGLAAMGAVCLTNPLEVLKTRMQLQGELRSRGQHAVHYKNALHAGLVVARTDGLLALQKGLVAALWNQFIRNGTRFGLYEYALSHGLLEDAQGRTLFGRCVVASGVCGALGALASSPVFMIKTHLQAESAKSIAVGYQRHHTGTWDALRSIYAEQGLAGLWRGTGASTLRAVVGSTSQLTTFTMCKQHLGEYAWLDGRPMLITTLASLASGIILSVMISPFDLISTRLYNQPTDAEGRGVLYRGTADCAVKVWRTEGLLGLFKGVSLSAMRQGPHSMLCLLFWDQLRLIYQKYKEP